MKNFSSVSIGVLLFAAAACSQAPAKAEEADTKIAEVEAAEDSGFNIEFPGDEDVSVEGTADASGFNFNIPGDEPDVATDMFNLPAAEEIGAEVPILSLPEVEEASETSDDEPIIRLD